ncbi:uncharacterized protein GGS22DRAFT_107643 [Annulohypoxylon maeteangense]|uniref:uncharacterized protein n=1 Tax=Annulohypoxylon maeteangense TaxID=1927788 RepID=UPI002008A5B1|nr:uncharacterized protein GGS22DRAFT_107643 [Annulohypoxylon maeteangense]KAI0887320.1 hypothetical protein GGS22DRAFT_107643 [Annulohypoxylon maeteangense]
MKRRADSPAEGDPGVTKARRLDLIQYGLSTQLFNDFNSNVISNTGGDATDQNETAKNDADQNDAGQNEAFQNETGQNETGQNETNQSQSYRPESYRSRSYHNQSSHDDGDFEDGDSDNDVSNVGTPIDVATPLTEATTYAPTPAPVPAPALTPAAPKTTSGRKQYPSDLKTRICHICNLAFNRPCRLEGHMRTHTGERPFKCDECGSHFATKKSRHDHMKSHDGIRDHVCTIQGCGKAFAVRAKLMRHLKSHEKKKPLTCVPCNMTFRKPETLDRHMRTIHHNAAGYACDGLDESGLLCQASFDNAASLRRHKERQHGLIKFWCDECQQGGNNIGFPTVAQLDEHIKKNHHKHKCTFCGFQCNLKLELDQHVESQHNEPKKSVEQRKIISCTWPGCTKLFTKKSNMDAHVKAYHQGTRFVCGEFDVSGTNDLAAWNGGCGLGFTTKGNLEKHIRHVHLKLPRPEQAQGQAKTKESSTNLLGQLAGVDDGARQTLRCLLTGCDATFVHIGELQEHLRVDHDLAQHWMAAPETMPQLPVAPNDNIMPQQPVASYTYPDPTLQQTSMPYGNVNLAGYGQGDGSFVLGQANSGMGLLGGQALSGEMPNGINNFTQPNPYGDLSAFSDHFNFLAESAAQNMGQGQSNLQAENLVASQ